MPGSVLLDRVTVQIRVGSNGHMGWLSPSTAAVQPSSSPPYHRRTLRSSPFIGLAHRHHQGSLKTRPQPSPLLAVAVRRSGGDLGQ
ncbi:hypothetical protein V6N12_046525 [Hibiscus sabdariffa]|uniref:Uncharacterized protein n=1 Tax=Hibiscus sabdariffa TaxID=183260 RepID=A0ABR2DIX7_9ROSI